MSRKRKPLPSAAIRATIDTLNHDGRGVARIDGKATFIEGALPGEEVDFTLVARHKRYDEGRVSEVIRAAPERVAPHCVHFGLCGGCSLQHLHAEAQIAMKQQILLSDLRHIGDIAPEEVLPPLTGPHWGYRRRARLGAKFVEKKQSMLVGFREKRSAYLADLSRCEVLHPRVGQHLVALRELLCGLDGYQRIPQVEVAAGDQAIGLVFRHLDPLSEHDLAALRAFGEQQGFYIYLQAAGPDSATPLWPADARLSYRLAEFDVELQFRPTDFTQVNGDINGAMVKRALELLDLRGDERVLDLFCGLGNFTLPIARRAAWVVGVEGDAQLVARARDNARHNGIDNAEFHAADLSDEVSMWPWAVAGFDKILLDPPRTGALEVVRRIAKLGAARIVYVSCNPATFARDAAELVQQHGYRLRQAGVMDMFPHTTHVECIALFELA